MRDRTEPPRLPGHPGRHLCRLDDAVRAVARDTHALLGQARVLEAQIDRLSRSVLRAARAVEEAKQHRDA